MQSSTLHNPLDPLEQLVINHQSTIPNQLSLVKWEPYAHQISDIITNFFIFFSHEPWFTIFIHHQLIATNIIYHTQPKRTSKLNLLTKNAQPPPPHTHTHPTTTTDHTKITSKPHYHKTETYRSSRIVKLTTMQKLN